MAHPPKVSYVVTGGTLRITTEDGQSFLTDEKTGSVTWMDTVGRHHAQNVGKTPVRIVLVRSRVRRENCMVRHSGRRMLGKLVLACSRNAARPAREAGGVLRLCQNRG